ncbi:alpha/beta hydrolase family esterase [Agromyces seonyuensis]|uniref:Polyhydroxybutyrate depolymerase n=1 Tax=Agromyces seonyuensis TaxID=2662446 RepID=A0A6I4P415_9MICO|nr:PHB depolymerase family esterase [Agromyces seonyuensis]MWB98979.1 polyhydroxybutyrate depolymerase [Agromyces seonyuensis]
MSAEAALAEGGAAPKPRRRRVRRVLAWIAGALAGLLVVGGVAAWWFLWAPAPAEPDLAAEVVSGTIEVDGLERSYLAVVPDDLPAGAPVVLAFHGSNMDAAAMRSATGYRFDELAVERGFVAVYPQGYEKTWHDCRAITPYPARTDDIDDEAFVAALVGRLGADYGIDADRVFATGLSNGGHFSLRLALERPDLVAGVAAFAAAYPLPAHNVCEPSGTGVPTMLVLGDADPINPFEGGMADAFGTELGEVYSAAESAAELAALNGDAAEPTSSPYSNTAADGETDVTAIVYDGPAPVELYEIAGGGHVVPNPVYAQPRLMGGTTQHLDGPLAAVDFFESIR